MCSVYHCACLGHGNDAIFGHHLNIGSLIGLLCDGLEEQIQSRTYFYKNSKLVGDLYPLSTDSNIETNIILGIGRASERIRSSPPQPGKLS